MPSNKAPSVFTEEMRKEGGQLLLVILQAGFQLRGQTLAVPPASLLPVAEGLEAPTAGTAGPSCAGESHLNCTWFKGHPLVTLFLSKLPNSLRAEMLHQSISILWVSNTCLMADVFHEHRHKRVFGIYYEALHRENCVKMKVCKTQLKMLSIYLLQENPFSRGRIDWLTKIVNAIKRKWLHAEDSHLQLNGK